MTSTVTDWTVSTAKDWPVFRDGLRPVAISRFTTQKAVKNSSFAAKLPAAGPLPVVGFTVIIAGLM
jgi:hypothetical protein